MTGNGSIQRKKNLTQVTIDTIDRIQSIEFETGTGRVDKKLIGRIETRMACEEREKMIE